MLVRFGYVAIALDMPEGSPNKTTTLKSLEKLPDQDSKIGRLRRLLSENLATTLRILHYNAANKIQVYRFTSKTVPLATHPVAENWDYIDEFQEKWLELGQYIHNYNIRVSAHPDHYTLLNSPQKDVLASSLRDLDYHVRILEAMHLPIAPQLVMHVGGLYKNKESSLERFSEVFKNLPDRIKLRLMLENDDKSYSGKDVLTLCQHLNCPMVLDIHHHYCLHNNEAFADLWPDILKTWGSQIPKIHVSSPRSNKDFRSHADYIEPKNLLNFLAVAREFARDFDVMVEAKQKDLALFKLVEDLEASGIKRIGPATIEI